MILLLVLLSGCAHRDSGAMFDFGVDAVEPCVADRYEILHLNAGVSGHKTIVTGQINAISTSALYMYEKSHVDFQYMIVIYAGNERIAEWIYSAHESKQIRRRFLFSSVGGECRITS